LLWKFKSGFIREVAMQVATNTGSTVVWNLQAVKFSKQSAVSD